jgi:hypothetical protein
MSEQPTPTGPEEGAPQTAGEQSTQDPGIVDQLSTRFDQLEGGLGEIRDWITGQQADPYAPQDPYAQTEAYQPQQLDPYGQPVQGEGQALDPQMVQQMIQQGINQGLAPIQQHLLGQQLNALADKYPDMRTPEVLAKIDQTTGQIAQRMGNPNLATDPEIVEMAYMAHRAQQLASQQTPAGQHNEGATLEQSGAAPPQEPTDPADELFGPRDPNTPKGPFGSWAVR